MIETRFELQVGYRDTDIFHLAVVANRSTNKPNEFSKILSSPKYFKYNENTQFFNITMYF